MLLVTYLTSVLLPPFSFPTEPWFCADSWWGEAGSFLQCQGVNHGWSKPIIVGIVFLPLIMIGLGWVSGTMHVCMYYVDSIVTLINMLRMAEEKYGSTGTSMMSLSHWINQSVPALFLNIVLLGFLLLATETVLSNIPPVPTTYFANSDNTLSITMQPFLE